MKVGLLGFEFVSPNKGCEALSYSFLNILKRAKKSEIEIYVFSNIKSLGMSEKKFPEFKFTIVPLKVKDYRMRTIRAFMDCDCVFDITMGDSFSDIYSKKYCIGLIRYKRIAEFFAKKYILLPQTYGPFTDKKIECMAMNVIKRADEVYARDPLSKEYLENNCKNVKAKLFIDLAFMLPYEKEKYKMNHEKINLGLNISGLLWRGGFIRGNQFELKFSYKEYINELLNRYCHDNRYNVHLIPHVIDQDNDAYDDDYKILKLLNKKYPNTVLAPPFKNPIEAKSYISNMDCFLGGRLHSTIAAFSSGVATIPFSYSRKFEGLYNLFEYQYLIHGRTDSLLLSIEKSINYIENYREITKRVVEYKKVNDIKMDQFVTEIAKVL